MSVYALLLFLSLCLPLLLFLGVVPAAGKPDIRQVISRPLDWFRPDPRQPRKNAEEAELRRLGESLQQRQNEPVQAQPDGTIIDGWRRWLAAKLVGLEQLDVIITEQPLTDTELAVVRLTSFFHKADLTGYEKWLACTDLLSFNAHWRMKDLAEALKIDPSMATKLVSPSSCSREWQEALMAGKVGISDCYAASQHDPEGQAQLLALKLSGASRDQIEREGRKKRNGSNRRETVRLSRVKCPLSSGVEVTVAGKELSISDFIDALSELIKEAKRAADQGLDIRTLAAVAKDKAKKGA
jgi:ParB/RepB/Spo0J family partition protein